MVLDPIAPTKAFFSVGSAELLFLKVDTMIHVFFRRVGSVTIISSKDSDDVCLNNSRKRNFS